MGRDVIGRMESHAVVQIVTEWMATWFGAEISDISLSRSRHFMPLVGTNMVASDQAIRTRCIWLVVVVIWLALIIAKMTLTVRKVVAWCRQAMKSSGAKGRLHWKLSAKCGGCLGANAALSPESVRSVGSPPSPIKVNFQLTLLMSRLDIHGVPARTGTTGDEHYPKADLPMLQGLSLERTA